MKRSIIYLSILLTFCVGCKRVEVDFSYAPTAPRAGETVTFTNLCTEGEEWLWTFGDNATSLAKNPNHIYKKPGTYLVTLMVDSAKYNTRTKEVTVYDTIPTFVCSTDSILHYQDVTFTANVYNPFNHSLTYEWIVSPNFKMLSQSNEQSKIYGYFKTQTAQDSVTLRLTLNGKEFLITKHFPVHLTKAPAIVMCKTDYTIIRQRLINDRIEQPTTATTDKDLYAIEHACDTAVTFNGKTFYANTLASTIYGFNGLDIQRVQLDAMAQKWYVTTPEGLYVANFDGAERVLIDENATGAIYVDINRNRLYWASNTGTYAMPLIKSKNNQFTTTPAQYNNLNNIDLITVNNTPQ
jgi:PKD repeat protein